MYFVIRNPILRNCCLIGILFVISFGCRPGGSTPDSSNTTDELPEVVIENEDIGDLAVADGGTTAADLDENPVVESYLATETDQFPTDEGPTLAPAAATATEARGARDGIGNDAADSGNAGSGNAGSGNAGSDGAGLGNAASESAATGTELADNESGQQVGTQHVVLGSPELTAGIPGEGPLQIADIQAWLDKPENHEPLDIELPYGLSAGSALIQGIEENPLTRAKIELGRQLYFDTRLSSDNSISCASCHHPDEGYSRHTPFGIGVAGQTGDRNSPVAYNRILSGAQFWDGRAESLEAQAVGPIANPIEMSNSHETCVETLSNIDGYKLQFEKIFPEGLTIDTVGKAIATFERVIVTLPAPYDYYELVRSVNSQFEEDEIADLEEEDPELFARYSEAQEKSAAMSASARRGRELFFTEKANCTACHAGANFTDEKYHNLGVGMEEPETDLGRFNVTGDDKDRGGFKTPTLRNVSTSAPYMHDGSQADLQEVVEWYVKGGHPNDYLSDKMKKLDLSDQDKKDLVAFMDEGLTSSFPPVQMGRLPE